MKTAVCIASGESLTDEDVQYVRDHRPDLVIAVNTTFRRAPWADILYASDEAWWDVYGQEARSVFKGEFCRGVKSPLTRIGNSGHGAIERARELGCKRILLLGYDFQGSHWHGDHGNKPNGQPLGNPGEGEFEQWMRKMAMFARRASELNVINCSRQTAIECFPRMSIEDALS